MTVLFLLLILPAVAISGPCLPKEKKDESEHN